MTKKLLIILFSLVFMVACGGPVSDLLDDSDGGGGSADTANDGGGGSDTGGGGTAAGSGVVRFWLTDAPAEDYLEVNVTVLSVRIHRSASAGTGEAGWETVDLDDPTTINLLDLQGGTLLGLGDITLEAGHYQQIRLVLASEGNTVVVDGAEGPEEYPLVLSSQDVSGLKINVNFKLDDGETVDIVLDFDGQKSVKNQNGSYRLSPVIKATVEESGGTAQ